MFGLSYGVLSSHRLKGMRNGNWRLLDRTQRGFYRACVAYAKLRGAIVNPKLVRLLRALIEQLKSTYGSRTLEVAEIEVSRMASVYLKAGVFNWVPQLCRWLQEETYLVWLGLMKLNTPALFQS